MSHHSVEELDSLSRTEITEPIPAETLMLVLSAPPFVLSPSLFNLRDLGAVHGSGLPSARAYRCGTLDAAAKDPDALAWLGAHVRRIFDFRRETERTAAPDPVITGVENVWNPEESDYPNPSMKEFIADNGVPGWKDQYMSIALAYRPTIRALLEHVRDRPTEPFLFHCTAGRDRTGVVAGILQTLAGTDPEDVKRDYLLSRIGIEPAREKLYQYAMMSLGITEADTPGFVNLVSLRPEFWDAFTEALQERFGSFEGYVTEGLGFSTDDLETIKTNLRS